MKKIIKFHSPEPPRLEPELVENIAIASQKLNMSRQETLRLSIRVGLEKLRRINYDVAGSILSSARVGGSKPPPVAFGNHPTGGPVILQFPSQP
jgi:hypothetical protein